MEGFSILLAKEVATQGLGYVLFVLACIVVVLQDRRIAKERERYDKLQDKHLDLAVSVQVLASSWKETLQTVVAVAGPRPKR